MSTSSASEELLNSLGEAFAQRLRRGENPSISGYSSQYPPSQADEIEEFLESIAMLEDLKRGDDASPGPRPSESMPEHFGRYRIERTLGEGGMGAVYLALDSQLNRRVALKTPKFSKKSDSMSIDRFYREARSAATLHHANICPVYDVGELDGIHYISMAYIDGHQLSEYINPNNLPPIVAAVSVVRKVADALHEAHTHGILHRDLKPANIMIDHRNEPIVMDFGLARQFGLDDTDDVDLHPNANVAISDTTKVEARLTQDGTLLGSPGYMSPELIRGQRDKVGPASDVYALGVLMYELLTGELPFKGDGRLSSIITAVMTNNPPAASSIRPDIDPKLDAIFSKALAKEVEDRYESMQAFSRTLIDYLKSTIGLTTANAIPNAGANETATVVRAKEQCELVRSLHQERQFAAALSILEKMVSDTTTASNQYIDWARGELPRVRANVQQSVAGTNAPPLPPEDNFWSQSPDAETRPANGSARAIAAAMKPDSQVDETVPRWFYGVVSVPIIVISLLVAAAIGERMFDNSIEDASSPNGEQPVTGSISKDQHEEAAEPTSRVAALVEEQKSAPASASNEAGLGEDPGVADGQRRVSRFGIGPIVQRVLMQFDANKDRKLSKAELRHVYRLPRTAPMRQAADNFDAHDKSPSDGLLDENELVRAMREYAPPPGRYNRRPRDDAFDANDLGRVMRELSLTLDSEKPISETNDPKPP